MSKIVLQSRSRTGNSTTSDAQLAVNDTVLFMSYESQSEGESMCFALDEYCLPNTFPEVTGSLILDELGVGVVTIPLSGYFTYQQFAAYLQNRLNAEGTLTYTVTFNASPFASYTINATGQFRFDLTRPVPDLFYLSDTSVHLGLQPILTPYATSITSTRAAILNVNTHILLQIQPLPSNSVMSSAMNFCYIVPVDADKTEYIRFKPQNQFKQKIEVPCNSMDSLASWRVIVQRLDGSRFTDLADWTATLGYSLRR